MMNDIWSNHVQGINTLYLSRKLRFDDRFSAQYRSLFRLREDAPFRVLEVGCGPGALAEALHRWYPLADIHGIDRDSRFVAFASCHAEGISFVEGDATCLPFGDGSFDVVISHTVQEHIEPAAFWSEQRRVLKPDGVCLCLSVRKSIVSTAPCLALSEEEEAFWAGQPDRESDFAACQVCRYPMSEAELPASMAQYGFRDITTGYVTVDLTPDDPKTPSQMAEAMIESDRQCELEAVHATHSEHTEWVMAAINARYDKRLCLYREGKAQWDTSVSVLMVLRGVK